jgi:hypothetical protein
MQIYCPVTAALTWPDRSHGPEGLPSLVGLEELSGGARPLDAVCLTLRTWRLRFFYVVTMMLRPR